MPSVVLWWTTRAVDRLDGAPRSRPIPTGMTTHLGDPNRSPDLWRPIVVPWWSVDARPPTGTGPGTDERDSGTGGRDRVR